MPILIESSDDEELTVKPESEPFLSDDEYHSLFISSDDEDTTAQVKEERERHTSGYGSDLEIIGEEAVQLVKVKEEKEDKIGEKVEGDTVKQDTSNSLTSVSDDSVRKKLSETAHEKSPQVTLGRIDDESDTVSNKNESHTPGSPHNVDLVAVADEEVRKFLTGGISGEIQSDNAAAERRSKVAEEQSFSDSSDDESFEDLEGDFLEKKELEKKKLAEAEKNRAMLEKDTVQSGDSSDGEDEDLEGDFLSRIEKEMKNKREMSSSQENNLSGNEESEKETLTTTHKHEGQKQDLSGNDRNENEALTSAHKHESRNQETEGQKEISVSVTTIKAESQGAESECHDDKAPFCDNPSDVSDDDSDNGEVTFKPGTPKWMTSKNLSKNLLLRTLYRIYPTLTTPLRKSKKGFPLKKRTVFQYLVHRFTRKRRINCCSLLPKCMGHILEKL